MPFMSGFGEGFSTAFAQRQQLDAVAERDAFQIAYETYTKNKEKYDADKKADEAYKTQAKNLVKSMPNVDPNAWTYAYEQLRLGFNVGQVEDKLLTTKFAPIPTAPQVDPAIGAEMANSGMAPDQTQQPTDLMATDPTMTAAPPPNVAAKPTMTNNPFVNVGKNVQRKIATIGNPQAQQQLMAEDANSRVKGLVGEGYDEAMGGFTPEPVEPLVQPVAPSVSPLAEFGLDKGPLTPADLARVDSEANINLKSDDPELKAKALRWIGMRADIQAAVDENGEGGGGGVDVAGNPLRNAELDARLASIAGGPESGFTELTKQKGVILSLQSTGKQLEALLKKNGGLNSWGAKLASVTDEFKDNMLSVAQFSDQLLGTGFSGNLRDFEKQIAKNSPEWKTMAADQREFAAIIVKLKYQYAKGLGQTGSGQSDKDLLRMDQMIANSVGPTEIINGLKSLIAQDATELNFTLEEMLNGSPAMQNVIRLEEQAYDGQSFYREAVGPLTPEQMTWANSDTPEMSISGEDEAPETPAPIDNPTPEQTGALIGKGVIETEEQLADIKAATGSNDWQIGDTYTEYENGFDKDDK